MSDVQAVLYISVNVTCPKCDHYIDLMDHDGLNDEGWIIDQACPDNGAWTETHDKFSENIECPECKEKIQVRGMEW